MHQNCVKKFGCRLAASDYYILLRIRSSLLLIIYLVLMCNNDVIMSIYYYGFLRIIDLCAKMEAKTQRQTVSIRVATFQGEVKNR